MSKVGRLSEAALSDKTVARLVKGAAAYAGLDADKYSGHLLRAGLATAAGDLGASLADLKRQTATNPPRSRLATSARPTSGATTSPRGCSAHAQRTVQLNSNPVGSTSPFHQLATDQPPS